MRSVIKPSRKLWAIFGAGITCVHLSALAQAPGGRPPGADTPPAPPPSLSGPIVKIKQGLVQGFVKDDVGVFRGLPFAAAPVGVLRWRAPESPAKWQGVRASNAFSGSCNQVEDCLYLNVYRPANATRSSKLPVMMWIH